MHHAVVFSFLFLAANMVSANTPDTVTHFGDGPFTIIPDQLNSLGIGAANTASETTATSFIVPGDSGIVDLTFTFAFDAGDFLAEFGLFPASAVEALDPVIDNAAYTAAALAAGTVVFEDTVSNPGATNTLSLNAGEEILFYVIPDAGGIAGPAPESLVPLFTESLANPGQFDQALTFIDNGAMLLVWEDVRRDNGGQFPADSDFDDLGVSVNAELISVPEPASVALASLASSMLLRRRRMPCHLVASLYR